MNENDRLTTKVRAIPRLTKLLSVCLNENAQENISGFRRGAHCCMLVAGPGPFHLPSACILRLVLTKYSCEDISATGATEAYSKTFQHQGRDTRYTPLASR